MSDREREIARLEMECDVIVHCMSHRDIYFPVQYDGYYSNTGPIIPNVVHKLDREFILVWQEDLVVFDPESLLGRTVSRWRVAPGKRRQLAKILVAKWDELEALTTKEPHHG